MIHCNDCINENCTNDGWMDASVSEPENDNQSPVLIFNSKWSEMVALAYFMNDEFIDTCFDEVCHPSHWQYIEPPKNGNPDA